MDTSTSTTTAPEHASDNNNNCENKIISETDTELLDAHSETVTQPKTQQDLIREYYQNLQKHKYERFIEITMNQTTYTREEAIASLEKHKGDITLVIKEFLGVTDKREEQEKEQNSKSLNQKRYSVIRECMDTAAKNFAIKQEQAKRYNEMMERRQQKINEEAVANSNKTQ
jgi:hypothetical protein